MKGGQEMEHIRDLEEPVTGSVSATHSVHPNEGAVVRRIAIELYPGAYGLTLRIDLQSREELTLIVELFKELATGALREKVVEESDSFALSGLDTLRLLCDEQGGSGAGYERRLIRAEGSGRVEFVWALDRDGWRRCAALADRLYRRDEPGHLYLSQEGADDRPVELVYEKRWRTSAPDRYDGATQ
jgi:hypothetical protein